ncbi:MAG: transketolase, partial [Fusobacteriales bacterium]|nr:transketolase [Fusobacteriales bacterium]
MEKDVKQLSVNAIRMLGVDAIEKSKSGHPGIVLGAAPMAYTLWSEHLNVNPKEPEWLNRDRFVLSAGHGSMLIYSLLHLSGFDVSMEDIKNFRQWGSKTPGHPEFGHTKGVDTTTGPLGQGIATAVGMALAETHLAKKYNKEDMNIIDHFTYVICGDGDLMEGVSGEASSFAGVQKLGKLVVLYDSNDICLDGETRETFTEDVAKRYEAYGWQVLKVQDGNELGAIDTALKEAKKDVTKPTLIEIKTEIGHGAPTKAGKNSSHGAPLGAEETKGLRENLKWDYEAFEVPAEVYEDYKKSVSERGTAKCEEWKCLVGKYKEKYPTLGKEIEEISSGTLFDNLKLEFPSYEAGHSQATRNASNDAINAIAGQIPNFIGGSADLAHSNMTMIKGEGLFDADHRENRNIQFGVREFAMGAILNGMELHGGLKVFGGTFFVFSDYVKAAIRLSSLMGLPVTYVLTHDSIAVGEDGPTHEPIEQLAGLRAIPNINVIRPADSRETQGAWKVAAESKNRPTLLVLSRQNLNVTEGSSMEEVSKGAYVSYETDKDFGRILIATGSEVS